MSAASITAILRELFDLEKDISPPALLSKLTKMKRDEVVSLHHAILHELPKPTERSSSYRFVANSESSGLPFPCMSMYCRTNSLAKTANFGAIYADEIILFNPLSQIYAPNVKSRSSHLRYASSLSDSLSHLLSLIPLIENNIVTFAAFDPLTICPTCFAKGVHEASNLDGNYDLLFLAAEYFLEKAIVKVENIDEEKVALQISNVIDFFGHEDILCTRIFDDDFRPDWSIGYILSRGEVESLGIIQNPSTYFVNDLATITDISKKHQASNVLTSSTQMEIARSYFGNQMIKDARDIDYPMTNTKNFTEIIKFRNDHWHHIVDFRNFVEAAVKNGENVNTAITNEFANISKNLEKHKRTLDKSLGGDIAIFASTVGASVMTSGVSGLLSAVVGIVGTGHLATKIIPKMIDRFTEPEAVKDSKVYYAWKINGRT